MTKFRKIGLIGGTILLLLLIAFVSLSDMTKAKISLNMLGLHKKNAVEFANIKEVILDNQFSYCQKRENIPKHIVKQIEKYQNNKNNDQPMTTLSETNAVEGEEWNATCQPNSDLPDKLFKELYYSDEAFIISYLSGGIGVSNCFDFYIAHADSIELIGGTYSLAGPDIFSLALMLKSDKEMYDYTKLNSGIFQNN